MTPAGSWMREIFLYVLKACVQLNKYRKYFEAQVGQTPAFKTLRERKEDTYTRLQNKQKKEIHE